MRTQIRGSTQIQDGTIPLTKLESGYSIPTANLADGSNFILRTGGVAFTADQSMGNFKLTNVADPVAGQDAVNLRTAQALINGVAIQRVHNVATTNVALTGLQTIDGITAVAGTTITLLTGNTTGAQNGPWVQQSGAWTRPTWWASASAQKPTLFLVMEGTTFHDTKWTTITDGTITVDTTAITVQADQTGGTYSNGSGIGLTGSTFFINYGQGVEDDGSSNLRVKLDGSSLARSSNGLKIANGTAGYIMQANASGLATWTQVTGDVTLSNTGVATVSASFAKTANLVVNETPSGLVNGSNTSYTLSAAPANGSLLLFVNGQLMEPGAGNDYTISGATITMLFTLTSGDKIRASYWK